MGFILGAFFGAFVMFASLWFTRRHDVAGVIERAPDYSRHGSSVLEPDVAEEIVALQDAGTSDKEMTFDDIYDRDTNR